MVRIKVVHLFKGPAPLCLMDEDFPYEGRISAKGSQQGSVIYLAHNADLPYGCRPMAATALDVL
jgi:hypothetical protein